MHNLKFSFYLLALLVLLTACASSKQINQVYTASLNDSNALPEEIGKGDYVLLVQKTGVRKMDRVFGNHLANHYRGKVQEIYFPEIEEQEGYKLKKAQPLGESNYNISVNPYFEGEFADSEKYRFFLGIDFRIRVVKEEEIFPEPGEAKYNSSISYDFTYYILDRQKGKTYVCPRGVNNFSDKFEGYIKALEQVRQLGS